MKAALGLGLLALVGMVTAREARADALSQCIAAHEKGQSDFRAAQLIAAKESLIRCIERCPSEIALDCSGLLPQVEANTPSVVAAATDERGADVKSAKVVIDERIVLDRLSGLAVPLDPGEHRLRIEWPNGERAEQSIMLSEGEKNRRVVFSLIAKPAAGTLAADETRAPGAAHGDGRKTAAYVIGAASVGFLATFVVAALSGKQKENDLDRCKPYCSRSQADAMHTRYLIADVALGLTLATGGVASYLYFTSGSSASDNGASLRAPDRFVVGIQHSF